MKRKLVAGLMLLLLGLLLTATSFAASPRSDATEWSSRVVRLHVLAHSDSDEDQALKLAVRDAILAQVTPLFASAKSRDEALQTLRSRLPEVEATAQEVIRKAGKSYAIRSEIGQFAFPDRLYGDLFLPAGEYQALRLVIGEGKGANWWCVLFPPLCFTDWTRGIVRQAKPGTSGRETVTLPRPTLLPDSSIKLTPRSKLVEWLFR
jgi:stage II sporulation protein R